jgi:hypothetical protein
VSRRAAAATRKAEALAIAEHVLGTLSDKSYADLVAAYLNQPTSSEVVGESGVAYHLQIQGVWNSGKPGDLRLMAAIDDGSFRRWSKPWCTGLLMRPDGTLVG